MSVISVLDELPLGSGERLHTPQIRLDRGDELLGLEVGRGALVEPMERQ
jgi:hypothetical protein